jgi:hypothetical protein
MTIYYFADEMELQTDSGGGDEPDVEELSGGEDASLLVQQIRREAAGEHLI